MSAKRMKLPSQCSEITLERDKYRNEIWLHGNCDGRSFDLSTDGRVLLSPRLARRLASKLIRFAESVEAR